LFFSSLFRAEEWFLTTTGIAIMQSHWSWKRPIEHWKFELEKIDKKGQAHRTTSQKDKSALKKNVKDSELQLIDKNTIAQSSLIASDNQIDNNNSDNQKDNNNLDNPNSHNNNPDNQKDNNNSDNSNSHNNNPDNTYYMMTDNQNSHNNNSDNQNSQTNNSDTELDIPDTNISE